MRIRYVVPAFMLGLVLSTGASSPTLPDINGTPHQPLNPGDKLASVLIFFWHDCPVCNHYVPEINRLFASYPKFSFYIVQVDPDLNSATARKHAAEYDLRPPVLL